MEKVIRFFKDEEGVTAIEYSLMAAFIALAIVTGATLLGNSISSFFSSIAGKLDGIAAGL